jgi:uncharacterized membrane protein
MYIHQQQIIATRSMITPANLILILTATVTALIAGLFFAWSCSVTLGLARIPDTLYIAAMQAMNRAILNPVFLICFVGNVLLLPLSAYMFYSSPVSTRFILLVAASVVYLAGVFAVTIFGNVPLNESLDAFALDAASAADIAAQRVAFEKPWNTLNMIRTVASTLSVVLVIIACLSKAEE